jgi:integrase
LREVAPGQWELSVSVGKYDDGRPRRDYRRVRAENRADAQRQLAALVTEVGRPAVSPAVARNMTFDDAVEQYLREHLLGEKGREPKTVDDYRRLHRKWFSPLLGGVPLRVVDEAAIDDVFGRMRRAGLSRSRMNQARSMYAPFFRWARKRRFITRSPMTEFDLPTSSQVSKERTPPEVDQLSSLLNASVKFVPDIAPILTLGAVTGMRRGELVGLRRSNVLWDQLRLVVDSAVDSSQRVKATKTRKERSFYLDDVSLDMLRRHCDEMEERAADVGVTIAPDAFVFSLVPDCGRAMPPDYLTRRVAVLKDHLGLAEKRPETVALEDEAMRLFRSSPRPPQSGKTGPAPKGGMSFHEIGDRLGRSERWAGLAVASATRRETATNAGTEKFDASIVALRKFTSSELLDAGFNISMVAQRQGHGPQVLMKHYAKSRRSADRRAAEHLGSIVHRPQS